MGIPGLLKEIGKGERTALSKLAVEFLERNRRHIRIAIDIAIWQFQTQAGQGGQNPALRTFYYRLLRILALPIHPLFVYDGPKKPLAKRNKVVSRYGSTSIHNEMSKKLLQLFRFPFRTAPGEAEAECALLQREGVVDAVMSQDVDAVMWGSTLTLRDWSQEGTRGNKAATHVNVLGAETTRTRSGLDPDGMILIAVLSGGDYAPDGIPGFGPGLACEIARAHFGTDLLEIMSNDVDRAKLAEWKERLQYELDTNHSGYFRTKHKSAKLPADFPDETLLRYYTHPEVSTPTELETLKGELEGAWDGNIDTRELREYVSQTFNWQYRGGACKYIRSLAPALLAQRLLRGQKNTIISSSNAILERRVHFVSDGMPELRVTAIPADIVGLNIEDEEDNPEYVQAMEEAAAEEDDDATDVAEPEDQSLENACNSSRPRKKTPWDPRNPEKMWLPETVVKLGLPTLVEEWEQKQRDMLTDPRVFIANKARKINPSTAAAANGTRSITSYFATAKPSVGGHLAARAPSPKKSHKDPVELEHGRNIRPPTATSPTRRKLGPKMVVKAMPRQLSLINSFSLASHSVPSETHRTDMDPCPTPTLPINKPSSRNHPRNSIRRNRAPIQKSKTFPATSAEPILISSSPPPSPSPNIRPYTPPPPHHTHPTESQTADTTNNNDHSSDTSPLPSPSELFQSPLRRTTSDPTRHRTHLAKPPVSEIFGPSSTTTARAKKVGGERKKVVVLPRDSLPGTWKEGLDLGDDSDDNDDGCDGVCGEKKSMPRVSWIDLTDLR